jgi:polar amino acid transport system substrate-binding protein
MSLLAPFIAGATWLPGTAMANETQGAVVVFCYSSWPPYAHVRDGAMDGLSVRVLKEAALRAGLRAEFHDRPWKRCLNEVRHGRMDAVIDAAARDGFLYGPTSFSTYTNTFWVRQDSTLQEFTLDAFQGKLVGMVDGYAYPDALSKNPPFSVDFSVDEQTMLRKLATERVDAVVADLVSTTRNASMNKLAVRPLLPSHSVDRLYPSFHKNRRELHARIDAALRQMLDDGFIDAVYQELLGIDASTVLTTRETESQK